MNGRDLENVDCRIDRLRRRRLAREIGMEAVDIAQEGVRENVFLRTIADQERLGFLTPFGARSAKRRYEDERRRPGARRRNRRRLVHIDAAAEKELDDSYASP
ncbi:MAG TPA: hypothetical protein VHT21_14035 [Stellaceae bacterium]|nr:hypothetical protein [Stellaceae bacterium]